MAALRWLERESPYRPKTVPDSQKKNDEDQASDQISWSQVVYNHVKKVKIRQYKILIQTVSADRGDQLKHKVHIAYVFI